MRIALVVAVACLSAAGLCAGQDVQASIKKSTNIPAQELVPALKTLAHERGFHVVFLAEVVGKRHTQGAVGDLTTTEALTRLLEGTNLVYSYLDDKTVTILPVNSNNKLDGQGPSAGNLHRCSGLSGNKLDYATSLNQTGSGGASDCVESYSPENQVLATRIASAEDAPVQNSDGESSLNKDSTESRNTIDEVIVTAQKREERAMDVPISLSVVTAEDIDRRGLVSEEDYLRGIPGVSQETDREGPSIVIRGLETSPSGQNYSSGTTVATYFGETSTTNSAGLFGNTNVDLKLVDIERVEVLRGPQGTAFGNSSLGGAVRTIPVAPNLDRFEGKVAASYSDTSGTGGGNNMIQAVGNLPLIKDKLAIRADIYQFKDSGFYRNVAGSDPSFRASAASYGAQAYVANVDNVGSDQFTGGRIAALFQPTADLKFTLSYLTQKTETNGQPLENFGPYLEETLQVPRQDTFRGQTGGTFDTNIDLANVAMEYNFGWASLLATYSHIDSGSNGIFPFSAPLAGALPAFGGGQAWHHENSGEIRLTTKLDGPWNFLAGLYAEELKDRAIEDYDWYGDPTTDIFVSPGEVYLGSFLGSAGEVRVLKQKAAFGEASWEFLPKFTLTGGLRAFNYKRANEDDRAGLFFGTSSTLTAVDASGTTGRANLSYKPNENSLIYASWSQGFRLGIPQTGLPSGECDLNGDGFLDGTKITIASTKSVNSDTVNSYEFGGKFLMLDRRLSIDADVFRINWKGVPVNVTATCNQNLNFSYTANAGAARSQGVELQAKLYIVQRLRADIGGSWIDAKLTKDAPGLTPPAFAGDRLPGSPKLNANAGLQYEFTIDGYKSFVRADSIYVGTFYGDLPLSADTEAGGYVKVDTTARITIDSIDLDLFVHNLTNVDSYTFRGAYAGQGQFYGFRARPRTIGIQLGYAF